MITVVQEGHYRLVETKRHTKILAFDGKRTFAWVNAGKIGEILVTAHKITPIDHVLAQGKYRLYSVLDEKIFTDTMHLELLVGEGLWQGYLLPLGLPDEIEKRHRIIPTDELITQSGA